MRMRARRRWIPGWVAGVVTAVVVGGAAAAVAAAPTTARQPMARVRPRWLAGTRDRGAVGDDTIVQARVYLRGRDPAGLAAYARAVSDPHDAHYQHYLTPGQVRQRYGPTSQQTAAVTGWLTGAGLQVRTATSHFVAVRGTAAAIRRAFGTALHRYATPGGDVSAPERQPSVPAGVADDVLTVVGLDSTSLAPQPLAVPEVTRAGTRCSRYFGAAPARGVPAAYGATPPWALCGYNGAQLRSAYGVTGSHRTGAGATVAIVNQGALPTMRADADRLAGEDGDPAWVAGQYRQVLLCARDASCDTPGPYNTEEALDVETVHALAPGADVVYVGTSTTSPTAALDGLTTVVDHRLADIVSDSWYLKGTEMTMAGSTVTAFEQIFQQGAVEGISFFFGTGDAGDQAFTEPVPGWDGRPSVNYPASDPWVTAVGGTSLATDRRGRYRFETGWGDDEASLSADGTGWLNPPGAFVGGAGGGTSQRFEQPYYQHGAVPATLSRAAGGPPMRVVPDIAADADPYTGFRIGYTDPATGSYANHTTGGTSLACPLVAGIHAVAQQARGGMPQGFINPRLYALYTAGDLHDVTDHPLGRTATITEVAPADKKQPGQPGLITLGRDTSLHAIAGYDMVTGTGTPTHSYLTATP